MHKNKKLIGIIAILLILGAVFGTLYYRDKKSFEGVSSSEEIFVEEKKDESKKVDSKEDSSEEKIELKDKSLAVHIDGEIKNPGVYKLQADSILEDLVKTAGGFTNSADTLSVNLAELLKDNQKIIIPKELSKKEKEELLKSNGNSIETKGATPQNSNSEDKKININTATAEELDALPGVGPSRANDIIAYRDSNEGFSSLEDLKNVSGIGDKTFEKLKDSICN